MKTPVMILSFALLLSSVGFTQVGGTQFPMFQGVVRGTLEPKTCWIRVLQFQSEGRVLKFEAGFGEYKTELLNAFAVGQTIENENFEEIQYIHGSARGEDSFYISVNKKTHKVSYIHRQMRRGGTINSEQCDIKTN